MTETIKSSEQEIAISRVYARALLALAEETDAVDSVRDELDELLALISRDEDFSRFLTSPLVDSEERRESLERMFRGRMSDLLLDTLQVMNQKGRSGLIPALAETYRHEIEVLRGEVRVHVRSAIELSDAQREQLSSAVAELTNKKPTLIESVDDELIGGVVLRIGDQRIDTSVASQLRDLEQQMVGRLSQELLSGNTFISEESQ